MNRISLVALLSAFAVNASAQNQDPVVVSPITNITVYAGAPVRSIDLTAAMRDADVSPVVRLILGRSARSTSPSTSGRSPVTTTNFLRYVDDGRYFTTDPATQQQAPNFIHRSVPNFVIQGGGFNATSDPANPA